MKKLLILSLAIAVITAQAYPNAVIITSISDENISEGSWESSFVDISTEDQTSDYTPYESSLDQSSYDYSSDAISYSSSDWSSSSTSWDSGSIISSASASGSVSSSYSSGSGNRSIKWRYDVQPINSHQSFSEVHPHPHPDSDSDQGWNYYAAPRPMHPVWSTDSFSVISKQQLITLIKEKQEQRSEMISQEYWYITQYLNELDISEEERRQRIETLGRRQGDKLNENDDRFDKLRKRVEAAFENGVPSEAEITRIKEEIQHDQQAERKNPKGNHDGKLDNLMGHPKDHSQNIWKKVGKHILCFGVVALVITIIVKRCRRRRECRRRERMMHLQQQSQNQQPMPNSLPVSSPVPSTSHRHLIPLQNPFSVPQHQANHPYPIPTSYQQNSPFRAPQRNDIYVPFNPQAHCNPLPKVAEVNKKEINIESREKEIEMRQLPKHNVHQNYRQEIASPPQQQQQDQVQYIPVQILPNGQMVILSPPCNNAPQYPPQASRTHFYPNLDSQVVVGSPVPNRQYDYPMKSQ